MRRQFLFPFLIVGMASWCYAQNAPKEVMEIMKNYVKDSTAEFGFVSAKKWLLLGDSINAADIEVGIPIQQFVVKYSMLHTCSDSIPFNELLEPEDLWIIPIRAKGRWLYEVTLSKASGTWRFSKMNDLLPDNMWKQLRSAYPESTGISPVLIVDGLSKYLYFSQKGSRKIFYVRPGFQNDSLENVTPGSLNTLADSKQLVKHWKKIGKGSNNTLDKLLLRLGTGANNGGGK